MRWAQLIDATDPERFGGKAVSLARALRACLPVPPGLALADSFVAAIGEGNQAATAELARLPLPCGAELAVRSSAVGEDSASASFAGQHTSALGVLPGETLRQAVSSVWRSGFGDGALGYRARLGLDQSPRMGVVIQPLINASVAGVLFTRNPITGANERVIEAARDLGDSVVQGRVVPDLYRLSPDGTLIELTQGDKRTETQPLPTRSIAEQSVPDERAAAPTLNQDRLQALHKLALQCEQVWNCDHDIEWTFAQDGTLHLLQHRPITRRSPQLARTYRRHHRRQFLCDWDMSAPAVPSLATSSGYALAGLRPVYSVILLAGRCRHGLRRAGARSGSHYQGHRARQPRAGS